MKYLINMSYNLALVQNQNLVYRNITILFSFVYDFGSRAIANRQSMTLKNRPYTKWYLCKWHFTKISFISVVICFN